jgi:hypothetical protein
VAEAPIESDCNVKGLPKAFHSGLHQEKRVRASRSPRILHRSSALQGSAGKVSREVGTGALLSMCVGLVSIGSEPDVVLGKAETVCPVSCSTIDCVASQMGLRSTR